MLPDIVMSKSIRQFVSYFGVGGASALVEWTVFTLLEFVFDLPYLAATVLAFLVSTTTNWLLGRKFTFKEAALGKKKAKEILLVFLVSAIGLAFNMLLMALFVDVIGMNTRLLKTGVKILATGIVFVWNFFSRKIWVYRVEQE